MGPFLTVVASSTATATDSAADVVSEASLASGCCKLAACWSADETASVVASSDCCASVSVVLSLSLSSAVVVVGSAALFSSALFQENFPIWTAATLVVVTVGAPAATAEDNADDWGIGLVLRSHLFAFGAPAAAAVPRLANPPRPLPALPRSPPEYCKIVMRGGVCV